MCTMCTYQKCHRDDSFDPFVDSRNRIQCQGAEALSRFVSRSRVRGSQGRRWDSRDDAGTLGRTSATRKSDVSWGTLGFGELMLQNGTNTSEYPTLPLKADLYLL